MPMIDVYAPTDLFSSGVEDELAAVLTHAMLRPEGVEQPTATHLDDTAAYIHRLDPSLAHVAKLAGDPGQASRTRVLLPAARCRVAPSRRRHT